MCKGIPKVIVAFLQVHGVGRIMDVHIIDEVWGTLIQNILEIHRPHLVVAFPIGFECEVFEQQVLTEYGCIGLTTLITQMLVTASKWDR